MGSARPAAHENVRLSKVIDCPPSSENDVLVMSHALKGQHILAQVKPTRVPRVLVPPWAFGVSPVSRPVRFRRLRRRKRTGGWAVVVLSLTQGGDSARKTRRIWPWAMHVPAPVGAFDHHARKRESLSRPVAHASRLPHPPHGALRKLFVTKRPRKRFLVHR